MTPAGLIACFPSKSPPKTSIRHRLELEIVQHLPTFDGDDEYTMYDQKMDRSWNGMQKTPDGWGPSDKSGASNYSEVSAHPLQVVDLSEARQTADVVLRQAVQILFFIISEKSLIPAGSIACFPSKTSRRTSRSSLERLKAQSIFAKGQMTYSLHRTPVRSFHSDFLLVASLSASFPRARTDCTEFPDAEAEE